MPRFNRRGDWAAGIGGGHVTVNGTVIATNAGGAVWLDENRALYQHDAHLETYNVLTGEIDDDFDALGATELAAGGGVYAAKLGAVRVSNRSETYPGYGVGDVGPDGSVFLKTPDGLFNGQYVRDIQALGAASWSGLDASYRPVSSPDVPAAQVVPGRIYGLRRAGAFCCYLAEIGGRFIVQYLDRPVGVVVAVTPNAYRPDLMVLLDGRLRVIYAESEGEPNGSERIATVDPATFTALTPPVEPPPIDPPPVEPPTMPSVPEAEKQRAQAMLIAVRAERNFGSGQEPLPYVRAVAERLTYPWGLNGKRGDPNNPSGDILAYDFPGQQPQLFDVLGDAGGANSPQFNALEYPQPAGAVFIRVGDAPPPPPPPPPSDDVSKLRADVETLQRLVTTHQSTLDFIKSANVLRDADVLGLQQDVDALKHAPPPVILPKLRVRGNTGRSFGHGHSIDLAVIPE